jgi:hypothetical protein
MINTAIKKSENINVRIDRAILETTYCLKELTTLKRQVEHETRLIRIK